MCFALPLLDFCEISADDNGCKVERDKSDEDADVSVSILNIIAKGFVLMSSFSLYQRQAFCW